MKTLRIGMISFAHMHAASYLRALAARNDVEIVGIADEDKQRVTPFLETYELDYYADYHDLLRQNVDAVVVCSENARHKEITVAAAQAGKHVLCEKPLSTNEADMREMIETCRTHDVQLMTAFPCRFLTSVMQAKEAVNRGEIGEIVAMKGTNRGTMPGGWFLDKEKSGGGAVLDHTVHVMDLMHWFAKSEAEEVYAHAETLFHDVPIDDAGMVHVRFKNGIFAVLDPSWSRSKSFPTWGDVTLEIIGTKGVLQVDAFAQKNEVFSDDAMKAQWSFWGDNMDDGMIDGFVRSLLEGQQVPVTGEDGYLSTRVAMAAYRSAAEKALVRDEQGEWRTVL